MTENTTEERPQDETESNETSVTFSDLELSMEVLVPGTPKQWVVNEIDQGSFTFV